MDNTPVASPTGDVVELLDYLRESRGFDFSGYKRTSLLRRIQFRMNQLEISTYGDYIDRLQVDADEFTALFNTILINVTSFFRDPEAWELLKTSVIPTLLGDKGPADPIRVWSAGCSSGQEAYTIAILLAEALGTERYLEQVKIYATDVDEEALTQARQAVFDEGEMRGVPDEIRSGYFERRDGRYAFRPELRRSVIFGRNDLVQDAPISRIDLLLCRNTLMYFNAEAQARILGRFHFALMPRGVLFLGKAEMLLSHSHIFEPLDLKRRVFRRVPDAGTAPRRLDRHDGTRRPMVIESLDSIRAAAFGMSPVAHFAVTTDDTLALFNQQAALSFGLTAGDIGRPLRDLDVSFRPVELRGHLDEAKTERRTVRVREVEWRRPNGVMQWFDVHVSPLLEGADLIGISFLFHDVTAVRMMQLDLERTNHQLENTNEELQSTNEELETTNEELQSTVEELETTNEELQSTNEELETMNEELQSTNDELQVINDTLRERSAELNDVNDFLESILTGIKAGVIVVDDEMRILAWNAGAQELWGLRQDEAQGQHVLNLDVGLPMTEIRPLVREALTDESFVRELTIKAVNRRGRHIAIRLIGSAMPRHGGGVRGALLVMETLKDG